LLKHSVTATPDRDALNRARDINDVYDGGTEDVFAKDAVVKVAEDEHVAEPGSCAEPDLDNGLAGQSH
jgi:hypothetical protein